jgi:hypothetical protein
MELWLYVYHVILAYTAFFNRALNLYNENLQPNNLKYIVILNL